MIEACPPSDSVTALTADMLIEPNGELSIVSVGDQIHDNSLYTCWGLSVPQSSVEPELLNINLFKIAEACRARGVIGYFAVDFVTFIHPKTVNLVLLYLCVFIWYYHSQILVLFVFYLDFWFCFSFI